MVGTLPKISMLLAVNLLILGFLFFGFGREYLRANEIKQQIASLEQENKRLEGDRLETLDLINELSSTYYLESEARVKRGMGLPGETLVVVDMPGQVQGATDSPQQVASDEGLSNPTRWLYYFFNQAKFEAMQKL